MLLIYGEKLVGGFRGRVFICPGGGSVYVQTEAAQESEE